MTTSSPFAIPSTSTSAGHRAARVGRAATLLLAVAGLGGCATIVREDPPPSRATFPPVAAAVTPGSAPTRTPGSDAGTLTLNPADASVWPARMSVWSGLRRSTLAGLSPLRRPMGVIEPVQGPFRPMPESEEGRQQHLTEQMRDVWRLTGRRRGGAMERPVTVVGEGVGSYVFIAAPDGKDVWERAPGKPAFYLRFMSARAADGGSARGDRVVWATPDGDEPVRLAEGEDAPIKPPTDGSTLVPDNSAGLGDPDSLRVLLERTWFAFYEPDSQPSRGTVVLLPGMFGTPTQVIEPLVGRLKAQGWSVLRMLAHPSRFTERVTFGLIAGNDHSSVALQIAELLGQRAAETAYAVQAAMLYVDQERPSLKGRPTVLLGMSGGAVVAPTVLARDPDRYSDAVLIAGGVNYLELALTSNYSGGIDSLRFIWVVPSEEAKGYRVGEPLGKDREALIAAYNRVAVLDAAACAPLLSGRRTLLIQANSDLAVPSQLGDRLWERAGRPERWVVSGGHEWLFLSMPTLFDRLMNWLDASARPPAQPNSR